VAGESEASGLSYEQHSPTDVWVYLRKPADCRENEEGKSRGKWLSQDHVENDH